MMARSYCLCYVSSLAVCDSRCHNGGTCIAPNQCKCTAGYVGDTCKNGELFNYLD